MKQNIGELTLKGIVGWFVAFLALGGFIYAQFTLDQEPRSQVDDALKVSTDLQRQLEENRKEVERLQAELAALEARTAPRTSKATEIRKSKKRK